MAAATKPPHVSYVVDCPTEEKEPSRRRELCVVSLITIVLLGVIGGSISILLTPESQTGDPVFSVAVAGVAGLDPARDFSAVPPAALSPVFNLTFHIDNTRNSEYDACVPGLSTAEVSYGDALLAKGSMPPFCAKEKQESEPTAARAWGDAVAVPRFLRDELAGELAAGEAEVDVKVTMPRYCTRLWCHDRMLSCKAKVGGGASPPCRLDYVETNHHNHEDD